MKMKIKLTRKEISDLRDKIVKASHLLNEVVDDLTEGLSDRALDELDNENWEGDDPISNAQAAYDITREVLGQISADSEWVEVEEKAAKKKPTHFKLSHDVSLDMYYLKAGEWHSLGDDFLITPTPSELEKVLKEELPLFKSNPKFKDLKIEYK